MIAGVSYYENRLANDNPVLVKHKGTGFVGTVTRVTPAGDHNPAQAYVVYGDKETGLIERWELVRDIVRVS